MDSTDNDLDPRIQIELENLNAATDEINKLEIEFEEANSTFRILMNESTRRLKVLSKKLGNCIDKARPYYDALEKAREAQIECQKAAVKFQRANEIHAAAKETVALAEQRFMSNSHEWQFDNAWQESLNYATLKVMDAESKKAECHAEHQQKTQIFNAAEKKVQQLEERYRRSIQKSRPYFDEKQICQDQLQTQKNRILELQSMVQAAKAKYSTALRNLEHISEDIHKKRGDLALAAPPGPREPGVGAEQLTLSPSISLKGTKTSSTSATITQLPDINLELEKCDLTSLGSSEMSLVTHSSTVSEKDFNEENEDLDDTETIKSCNDINLIYNKNINNNSNNNNNNNNNNKLDLINNDDDLEELRKKVKSIAVRPVEGGDGQQEEYDVWENELNATVDKLDHLMMIKECEAMSQHQQKYQEEQQQQSKLPFVTTIKSSLLPSLQLSSTKTINSSLSSSSLPSSMPSSTQNTNNKTTIINNITEKLKSTKKLSPLVSSSSSLLTNNTVVSLPSTPKRLLASSITSTSSSPITISTKLEGTQSSIKKLAKIDPLPSVNVSMRELPLLARISNEIWDKTGLKQRRRSLE